MRFSTRVVIYTLALFAVVHNDGNDHLATKNTGFRLFANAEEANAAAPTTPEVEETTSSSSFVEAPDDAESFAFEADVSRMLDIVVNSLYQNKDVFLRELISNASDALDKIRFLLLTEPETYKKPGTNDDEEDDISLEIKLEYDTEKQTLTIRDTGVGMTKDDLVTNLGTVARSGTTKFLEAIKEAGSDAQAISQIGQFGVGFYSTFLVADKVTVASKNPKDPIQHVWESQNGSNDFLVYVDPRGNTMDRGTEITLHLKEDALEYVDPERLKEIGQHYSEFVTHPISLRTTTTMEVEDEDAEDDEDEETAEEKEEKDEDDLEVGDDEESEDDDDEPKEKKKKMKEVTTHSWDVLNGKPAIWTREKDDIEDEEYQSFWHTLAGESVGDAAKWTHFNAEGSINFKSILYLPEDIPPQFKFGSTEIVQGALRLYVRKVLIGDKFDLLPNYLNFVHGVVDSDDLPLNVNRETLQESNLLTVIKKKLVRKVLDLIRAYAKESEDAEKKKKKKEEDGEDDEVEVELDEDGNVKEKSEDEDEDDDDDEDDGKPKYLDWYSKFSNALKLGAMDDEPNRSKLMKLLRFQTSKSNGTMISLETYVENMKEWQDDIYVFGGESLEELEKSPFLEPFQTKDLEVVYMVDPVDEYMIQHVRDFNNKKLVQISSENVKFKDEDEDLIKRREKAYKDKFQPLTKWLRKLYKDTILRVQVAKRSLGSVPAIVTSSDFGSSANMERILRAQAFQDKSSMQKAMRIFEINPRHPLIIKLLAGCPPEEEKKKKKDDDDDDEEEEKKEPFVVSDEIIDAAWMIHDTAMISGGFPLPDPQAHNERMIRVLQSKFALADLELEEEIDPPVEEDEPPEMDDEDGGGMNMDDFNLDGLDLDGLDLD